MATLTTRSTSTTGQNTSHSSRWGADLLASVVVFLVALPLCMGVAIASGVPPALGLITGIVSGLLIGSLAGCPLQVSGPAAGLAVMVWEIVKAHGLLGLGPVVLLAGLLQIAAGMARLGPWFRAVTPSVIHGMLAGIGVLIFSSQFHVMVDDVPTGSGLQDLFSIPSAVLKGLSPMDGSSHHLAAVIGVLTLGVLILWQKLRNKKLKVLPGPLVAVLVAVSVAFLWGFPIQYVSLPSNLLEAVEWPTWQNFSRLLTDPDLLIAGFALAFVASAETLLCATATDQMHDGPKTRYDQELIAQGVGNSVCGLLGALPATGVIVRSSANIEAGGKTRKSAILHGVWLLLFAALFPALLQLIPTASLAAILVFVGYRLFYKPEVWAELSSHSRGELFVYGLTIVGIVLTNLLTGILIGFAASALKLLYSFSHLEVESESFPEQNRVDFYLHGAATFLGLPRLAAAIEELPPGQEVHLHIQDLDYIDHACLELLAKQQSQFLKEGGALIIEWEELHEKRKPANFKIRRAEPEILNAPIFQSLTEESEDKVEIDKDAVRYPQAIFWD